MTPLWFHHIRVFFPQASLLCCRNAWTASQRQTWWNTLHHGFVGNLDWGFLEGRRDGSKRQERSTRNIKSRIKQCVSSTHKAFKMTCEKEIRLLLSCSALVCGFLVVFKTQLKITTQKCIFSPINCQCPLKSDTPVNKPL